MPHDSLLSRRVATTELKIKLRTTEGWRRKHGDVLNSVEWTQWPREGRKKKRSRRVTMPQHGESHHGRREERQEEEKKGREEEEKPRKGKGKVWKGRKNVKNCGEFD